MTGVGSELRVNINIMEVKTENVQNLPLKVSHDLFFILLMANLGMSNLQTYQTTCYQRFKDELLSPQSCTVTMQFDHPENGLDWQIIILSGQKYHYRNQGMGIEIWSDVGQKWSKVEQVDWFPYKEGILCWDDFCADWRELPLD